MIKIKSVFLSAMLVLMLYSLNSRCDEFAREYRFKPMKPTLDSVYEIVNDVFYYTKEINGLKNETEGSVNFKSEEYEVELSLPLTEETKKQIPSHVAEFSAHISSYKGILTRIIFNFGDSRRFIKIVGTNHDKVIGLLGIVKTKFDPFERKWSGPKFRFILAVFFYILLTLLFIILFGKYTDKSLMLNILWVVVIITYNICLYSIPWKNIFPGFLITRDGLNYLEKNAPLFTFLGLCVAIIVPLISIFLKSLRRK